MKVHDIDRLTDGCFRGEPMTLRLHARVKDVLWKIDRLKRKIEGQAQKLLRMDAGDAIDDMLYDEYWTRVYEMMIPGDDVIELEKLLSELREKLDGLFSDEE